MILKIPVLLLLLIFGFSSPVYACTSFAVYGNQIFYGMNFDYFAIPFKFLIESDLGMNTFHLSFLFDQTVDDPEYKGYFAKTCGINSKGLFCASQEIEPHVEGRKKAGKGEVHIDDQYETISRFTRVEQVREQIEDAGQWIQYIGPSIHNLFADISGRAMVTETDNIQNFVTEIENQVMVMSNFANHSLAGKAYKKAVGVGANRYMAAHEYLGRHMDSFSVDKGFELLKNVSLKEPDCLTLCSMIFEPEKNCIYICIHQDFEKVWKVSLDSRVIETYKGFDNYFQTRLGADGILSSRLLGAAV